MRPKIRNEFTTAIVCALPLEADAIEALFDGPYDKFGCLYGKQLWRCECIGDHKRIIYLDRGLDVLSSRIRS
jgi:hypothetical protein